MIGTVVARPKEPASGYFGFFFAALGAFAILSVILVVLIVAVTIQRAKEARAGYTWQTDQYQNLSQIDPVSNVVIREQGEAFLTTPQRKEAVARAREWATEQGAPE
ncbi:hypothetical protein [Leifsonia shinshuensis]